MGSTADVRSKILATVDIQLRRAGAASITIDQIAREAGCAKGLVNYHFKTKALLLAAAAERLFADRDGRWTEALSGVSADEAIQRSWRLIAAEATTGFWRAEASLATVEDSLTVRTVSIAAEHFAALLGEAVVRMLAEMHVHPRISQEELGHLLGAAIQGLGMQLIGGLRPRHVEGAYAALWVAILTLGEARAG